LASLSKPTTTTAITQAPASIYQPSGLATATGALSLLNGGLQTANGANQLYNTLSDRRFKRNVSLIGENNGIKLYSFQYLWSDDCYVGVMAQDLLGTEHESAVTDNDGVYTVDYSKLGFPMMLLSDYNSTTV